jgi:hypothetical protein
MMTGGRMTGARGIMDEIGTGIGRENVIGIMAGTETETEIEIETGIEGMTVGEMMAIGTEIEIGTGLEIETERGIGVATSLPAVAPLRLSDIVKPQYHLETIVPLLAGRPPRQRKRRNRE